MRSGPRGCRRRGGCLISIAGPKNTSTRSTRLAASASASTMPPRRSRRHGCSTRALTVTCGSKCSTSASRHRREGCSTSSLDRGCLHGIPTLLTVPTARNVAALSHEHTWLMVFLRIGRGPVWLRPIPGVARLERWLHRRRVVRGFRSSFVIEPVRSTDLWGPSATGEMPGMVCCFKRRPSAVDNGMPACVGTAS